MITFTFHGFSETASDGTAVALFGAHVSISEDIAIIGAHEDNYYFSNTGAAYVFNMPAGGWTTKTEDAKLNASDGAVADSFGCSVAIDGSYAVIEARTDDDNGNDSGSAYVFKQVVCASWLTADLSGDCFVDFVDFGIFANQWLKWQRKEVKPRAELGKS